MKNYEAEVNGIAHTFQLDSEDAKRAKDAGVDLKEVKGPRSATDPDATSEVDELRAENAALKAALAEGNKSRTAATK